MKAKKLLQRLLAVIKITLIFGIVVSALFLGILFFESTFQIRQIEVSGIPKEDAIRGVNIYQNKNLLLTSTEEIEKELIRENPQIESVNVEKKLPNKMTISVKLARPIAVLQANAGFFYLSQNGRIIFKRRTLQESLPMIRYYQKFDYISKNAGESISFQDLIFGLYFLKAAQDFNLKIDSIDIDGMHMIVLHLGEKKIFFTTQKEKTQQMYELEKIIHQFKIEGKEFKTIDLRFDRPVIVLDT